MCPTFPVPDNEIKRVEALERYSILDTPEEQFFNDVARVAAKVCGTPIALISLVDGQRQWFKAKVGLDNPETPRDVAFCAHAIMGEGVFEVPDSHKDPRFAFNPLVTGHPQVRFYAGAPIISADGFALGTVCAIDHTPRTLDDEQKEALLALGRIVMKELEHRLNEKELSGR